MKKATLLIITASFIFFNANSQITKGNWMIGGSMGFSSTHNNSTIGQTTTHFTVNLNPDVAYFIADKFASGFRIGFINEGNKATGTSRYGSYYDANFGPFLRYYFLPAEKQLNLLVDGTYQFGLLGGNQGGNTTSTKSSFALNVGPVVYFNSSVGLEFLIGYSSVKYDGFNGSNNTIQASLGIHVHLEK